ncbi:MAG TPA: hypothetical protein VMM92_12050 [Thermoanaerobaculia bacterium]|nr:hypothetical protein [Thermoanaerobaculia bacterium]
MLKKLGMVLLLLGIVALVAPQGAMASCTATLTCHNGCSEHLTCPRTGLVISCSAPNQVINCSGSSSCTVGTSSITCDGATTNCSTATRCFIDPDSVLCDSTFKACPTCGGKVCQSQPQLAPSFWGAPETATAPAEASVCF